MLRSSSGHAALLGKPESGILIPMFRNFKVSRFFSHWRCAPCDFPPLLEGTRDTFRTTVETSVFRYFNAKKKADAARVVNP